jgi:hypothetical protein
VILHGEIAIAADLHERKAVIPLIQNHVVGVEIAQTAGAQTLHVVISFPSIVVSAWSLVRFLPSRNCEEINNVPV